MWFYSNFSAGNIGKKRRLSVAERVKIVILNEEGYAYLGRRISKKLRLGKTEIY